MTDTASKKGRHRTFWMPLLVLITLAACASASYSYWLLQQKANSKQVDTLEAPTAPIFYALDTFTVNLGDADRVLYIGVTLRLQEEQTRQHLSEFLPEVRSRLLLLLSRQDANILATEDGKLKLIKAIKSTLATPLVAGKKPQVVSDVLYTAFILR